MPDILRPQLWDKSLRKTLKPHEQAELDTWLAGHPDQKVIWEEERMVSQWIQDLPPVDVSSNFTAQVVDRLVSETEGVVATKKHAFFGIPQLFHMHGVVICVLAVACMALFYIQNERMERKEVARHVVTLSKGLMAVEEVSELPTLSPAETQALIPPLDILVEFEAINQLTMLPAELDAGLLVALE